MKITPKSCSCGMCKRGKHTKCGRFLMNYDERRVRQKTRVQLKKIAGGVVDLESEVPTVPIGNYYD